MILDDEEYMKIALRSAINAGRLGEVPIGACVVGIDGEVISTGENRTIADVDPTAHAEILAIRKAAKIIGNYRLTECTVYTTIEPCVMCAGALVNARISRLVFGAADDRFGAVRTKFELCDSEVLNHRLEVTSVVLEEECRQIIQKFFQRKRKDL